MRLIRALVCSTLVGLTVTNALAASIGLFSTPDCASCNLTIPPGETRTLYIAVVSGSLLWSGAEFRVAGLPEGWTATSTPNPARSFTLGDPFGSRANIGFWHVQSGDCTLLYTVQVTATSSRSDVVLQVAAGDPPSNPVHSYPLLVPDPDFPCYCVYPADAGAMFINSAIECTVAVELSTWSRVKQLYD
jgi:hypothetical protein